MAACSFSPSLSSSLGIYEPFVVLVKFNGRETYAIDSTLKDSIRNIKEDLARKVNMPPNDINLVLAGQILRDDAILQECGLGQHTTLHAFCWSDDGLGVSDLTLENAATDFGDHADEAASHDNDIVSTYDGEAASGAWSETPVNSIVSDFSSFSSDDGGSSVDPPYPFVHSSRLTNVYPASHSQSRFFVYCKLCDGVRPAKLRLVCRACGSGAFVVDRGPSNWEDISSTTTIRGSCKSDGCSCTHPRFYLKCAESHDATEEGTAVLLKHVQANRKRVECIACLNVISHVLIFPCPPGHVICLECFRQYSSTCLSERRFVEHAQHGYTLPCPAGCPDSHIEESHHFLLMGKEKYERYKNFGAEEYVLQNRGLLCPAPGCGMGLFPEGNDRRVVCGECQTETCRECRRPFHPGACADLESSQFSLSNLSIHDERAERACWEQQSLSLIGETTKVCPGCQTKTERSGGCMHMVCTRCSMEWCWICVKPWNRDCQGDHWFG